MTPIQVHASSYYDEKARDSPRNSPRALSWKPSASWLPVAALFGALLTLALVSLGSGFGFRWTGAAMAAVRCRGLGHLPAAVVQCGGSCRQPCCQHPKLSQPQLPLHHTVGDLIVAHMTCRARHGVVRGEHP